MESALVLGRLFLLFAHAGLRWGQKPLTPAAGVRSSLPETVAQSILDRWRRYHDVAVPESGSCATGINVIDIMGQMAAAHCKR
jgi:hypothetical protein